MMKMMKMKFVLKMSKSERIFENKQPRCKKYSHCPADVIQGEGEFGKLNQGRSPVGTLAYMYLGRS